MMELVEKLRSCFFGCSYKGFVGQKPIGERTGWGGQNTLSFSSQPGLMFFFPLIDQQGSYLLKKYFMTLTAVRCYYLLSCFNVLKGEVTEDDLQRRFSNSAQHSVAMLVRCCSHWKQ